MENEGTGVKDAEGQGAKTAGSRTRKGFLIYDWLLNLIAGARSGCPTGITWGGKLN